MKLTGWFSQDKITDNSKVQTTDTQNAEQVSRQIRTLVPGQTIRGEVVSREGNNAQIRLLQDVLIDARVDADIRLDLGQNITFQVKNNGQVLSLSPLFTNMATEGTVLKALEMASLPTNESTVAMTKQLMDAGFPIDKNTLQQIWHESNVFPEAAIEDIVNLHRLELPVTEENLTQMASYRNLTYQLTEGITAVAESLNSTLQGLTTNGEIEQAATIYGHILELLIPGEENPEAQRATVQFPDPEQTETVLQPGEPMSQTKEAIAHTDTVVTNGTPEASKTMLPTQKMIVDGTKPEDAAEVVLKLLKQGLATKDTALLRSVLQNFKIAGLPGELLQDAWSIRPEDVESSEKVEELYQKLGKQLKSLAGLLEENGQSSSNAFQAVTNLSRNVDFYSRSTRRMPISSFLFICGRGNIRQENCLYIRIRKTSPGETDGSAHCFIWIWNIWARWMSMWRYRIPKSARNSMFRMIRFWITWKPIWRY